MTILDLGKNEDFQKATRSFSLAGSGISQLALIFGRPPEEWDIVEGSFNDVVFHVFVSKVAWQGALSQISDSGGRRLATFTFPYVDGQTTDDLGRMPEAFDLDILFYGDNYLQGLTALMTELQKPTPGDLIHPVRGPVQCRMQSYQLIHSHETRKAVMVKLRLVEHNFELASYGTIALDKNFKSVLGDLAKGFQQLNALITKLKGLISFLNNIRDIAVGLVEQFQDLLALSSANINSVFNNGSNTDIPTLTRTNLGGLLTTNSTSASASVAQVQTNIATITNSVFSIARRINDPFLQIPVDQLSEQTAVAIAAQTIQKQVEDARKAAQAAIEYLSSMQENSEIINTDVEQVDGAIGFYDEILQIKKLIVSLQVAFELGQQQNGTQIIEYTLPRNMSIREVAFLNNISLDNLSDIDILNPELLSVNWIPKGTVLKVAVA